MMSDLDIFHLRSLSGISDTDSPAEQHSSAKILFIDDDENYLAVVRELLTLRGFEVLVASNAESAIELLDQQTPQMILCDVNMRGIDGFIFHEHVSQHVDWCHIPFVFISGAMTDDDINKAKSVGCDDFIDKTAGCDHLLAVVTGKMKIALDRKHSLETKMERYRRSIINTLSHEFRTPLVAISTGTELLISHREALSPNKIQYLLESIQRGGNRLQRLVDDFMIIQQIDSGVAKQNAQKLKEVVSMARIANASAEYYQDLNARPSAIEINIPSKEKDFMVDVCEVQIRDVVCRLLSNSEKFAGNDGPAEIRVSQNEDTVSIHVRDHGPGLPESMAKNACVSFAQIGREKLEQQGAGLGLTIANYFVELNKGLMTFHSPESGGLEVALTFPKAKNK